MPKNLKLIVLASLILAYATCKWSNAATTGSITISGVVPKVVSITVTSVAGFNTLDLTSTQTALTVANVQEQSNDSLGYSVTIASANAGKLVNGSNNIAYAAKYNNVSFTLSTTPVTVTTQRAQTVVVNTTKPLTIAYTGVPSANMMSGTYSDTLTFTVSAN